MKRDEEKQKCMRLRDYVMCSDTTLSLFPTHSCREWRVSTINSIISLVADFAYICCWQLINQRKALHNWNTKLHIVTSSKTNLYRRMAISTNELMSWASTIVVKFLPYNKLRTHWAKKHPMQQTISAIFSMLWPSKELPQPPTMQSLTACVHFFAAVIFISLAVTDVVYTSVCCCFILLQRTGAVYQLHAQYSMYTNPSPSLSLCCI